MGSRWVFALAAESYLYNPYPREKAFKKLAPFINDPLPLGTNTETKSSVCGHQFLLSTDFQVPFLVVHHHIHVMKDSQHRVTGIAITFSPPEEVFVPLINLFLSSSFCLPSRAVFRYNKHGEQPIAASGQPARQRRRSGKGQTSPPERRNYHGKYNRASQRVSSFC